jgi:large subunit ribosomal protein L13
VNTLSYKTVSANKATVNKEWFVVDATDQILGRLSSEVAKIIRGKNKTYFTPHVDCGDFVIVINAEKVKLTGKKLTDKQYLRYTGYPGGERWSTPEELLKKNPASIIERAVKGMLPRNRLGNAMIKNLYVYAGSEHPHQAQQPKELKINTIK